MSCCRVEFEGGDCNPKTITITSPSGEQWVWRKGRVFNVAKLNRFLEAHGEQTSEWIAAALPAEFMAYIYAKALGDGFDYNQLAGWEHSRIKGFRPHYFGRQSFSSLCGDMPRKQADLFNHAPVNHCLKCAYLLSRKST